MAATSEKIPTANRQIARPTLIYGGTFDPPHAAHATLPLLVAEALDAAALIYVPAGRSPFKLDHEQSPPHHRRAMLERMLAELRPRTSFDLRLDDGELERGDDQPSYTIDTVRRLQQTLGTDTPLRLLLGTDQFFAFEQWRQAETLADLAPPVVMVRPPHGREQVRAFLRDDAPPYLRDTPCIDIPEIDISSTALRDAIRSGRDVTGWVSPAVLAYAKQHALYD